MKVMQLSMNAKKSSAEDITASMTISTIIVELDAKEFPQSPSENINKENLSKESSVLIKADSGLMRPSPELPLVEPGKEKSPTMNAEISGTQNAK